MIKTSSRIPDIIPDGSNPQELMSFLTAVKMVAEEIVNKAKSVQNEVHTTNEPVLSDFQTEAEEIRSDISGTQKIHTLLNGSKRSVTVT